MLISVWAAAGGGRMLTMARSSKGAMSHGVAGRRRVGGELLGDTITLGGASNFKR